MPLRMLALLLGALAASGCAEIVGGEAACAMAVDGPLRDGESNFLEAGTELYVVPGTPPTEVLAVWWDDRWTLLTTPPEG